MNCHKLFTNLGIGTLIALPIILANPEATRAEPRELMIHNHTGTYIVWLYVYPSSERYDDSESVSEKTIDRLGPFDILSPRETIKVTLPGSDCNYDIIGRGFDGNDVPVGGVAEFDICDNRSIGLTYVSITPIPEQTALR
ncbi:MAG: hypothetical protein QNJ64_10260 [Crocosphaera sp.]|nr:hypothetical protein [Crocosphaera sp.]